MHEKKLKFIADVMLGRTARWLRLFGYDTIYKVDADDDWILFNALVQKRTIITRDTKLAYRAGSVAYLVRANSLWEQLREITSQFSIEPKIVLVRCPVCNGKITEVEKKSVLGKVPEYTYLTHDKFWRCENCGKIYWRGSHLSLADDDIEKHLLEGDTDEN